MFTCTLKNRRRFTMGWAAGKRSGHATGSQPGPGSRIVRSLLLAILLAAPAWPAGAIEFVTQEAFNVEKSSYKDYPYRVLFEKFHHSTGVEKRKLRNVIILKQVFDPEIRQRASAAGAKFEAHYGVIKALSGDHLRLWLPASDSFKDFPVGIDRIPVENKQDYAASPTNISDFAAVVHTLDARVYKVEISFALPAPDKPQVQRRGDNNVVSWQAPRNVTAPSSYRVFVNDKLYKTVTGTAVEVPRSREQADEFYIKAVYTHHNGRIASAASPTLYDAASAKEIQMRQEAGTVYQQVTIALGQSDQASARKLMTANHKLLTGFLSPDRKAHILTAGAFFKALDEGDRLTTLRPETSANLAGARTAYQQASDAARQLPADFKLQAVAAKRLEDNTAQAAKMAARLQKDKARATLDRISADLKPGKWEQARKLLYQQQAFLLAHLAQKERTDVTTLQNFFQAIDKGDLSAGIQPLSPEHLEAAMQSYRQAEKTGLTLPAHLDASFIARQRIKATANRQVSLATEQQAKQAGQTWDKLVMALNPSEWQTAQKMLYENRALFTSHLSAENKAAMAVLVDFFTSLDEGDRLAARKPVTMDNLATADRYYQRAAQKAATLPGGLDVAFITQLKLGDLQKLTEQLQAQLLKMEGTRIYARITAAVNTGQWQAARRLLYEKQDFLATHLDARDKADCLTLAGFFRDIDEGDRLAGIQPPVAQNLDAALESYRLAVAKAQALPPSLDAGLIARQKIKVLVARKDQLSAGAQETQARAVYDQALAALTPAGWQNARNLLSENETLLAAQLDPNRKATVTRLLAFFQFIEDGDRLSAQQPVTPENLNMALSSYRLADQKAQSLAATVDLAFLTRQKFKENQVLQTALVHQENQTRAMSLYRQIEGTLTPDAWETGMRLALDKLPPEIEHLKNRAQAEARLLTAFFQDIEAGDRLRYKQPEIDSNLAQANDRYNQAKQKARSLAPRLEIMFILKDRVEALRVQRAALVKREQARMAAQQAAAAPPPPPPAPPAPAVANVPTADFDDSATGKAALKLGMRTFGKQQYDLSLRYFRKVYAKQIGKLKNAGKKQSFTVLSLHPKVRAEVIFLVQLEVLQERSNGDEEAVRDGLMDILDDVESGTGSWSIIKERKRNKIMKHIDRFPF
jgi:hypothetical protein